MRGFGWGFEDMGGGAMVYGAGVRGGWALVSARDFVSLEAT